jgi:predicted RNase H-like HicB family nuclease
LRKGTLQKAFTIIIERDPKSGWLVGEVVELPGCYSQAPDLPTLEANMKDAITVYLQATVLEEVLPSFVGNWQVELGG